MLDLREVAKFAIEKGKLSTSLIQREFMVGYARAAETIDKLEELGIVSAPRPDHTREVLVSPQKLDEIFFDYEPETDSNNDDAKSLTIMKYQDADNNMRYIVCDDSDIQSQEERLGCLNGLRDEMLSSGRMKKHIWTKEITLN